jgi:sigma-B regulation protein RsbU (phosphoserine phosphatase)
MHLTLFYGVVDARAGCVRYANAGHPHAFRLIPDGPAERLAATCPPLGLSEPEAIGAAEAPWRADRDRLLLFSDGLVDARGPDDSRFGEERVVALANHDACASSAAIVGTVLDAVAQFEPVQRDDRTIVVFRG